MAARSSGKVSARTPETAQSCMIGTNSSSPCDSLTTARTLRITVLTRARGRGARVWSTEGQGAWLSCRCARGHMGSGWSRAQKDIAFVDGRSVDGTVKVGHDREGRRARPRRVVLVLAVATCTASVLGVLPAGAAPKESPRKAPSGRAFYVPPDPLPKAAPGTLIWSSPFK